MTFRYKNQWFCNGCQKMHQNTRDIDHESAAFGSWCMASIKRARRDGKNFRPLHPEIDGSEAWRAWFLAGRSATNDVINP